MERAAYLDAIRTDAAAMAAAAASAGLDAVCPTCPGWTVRDVLEHTGMVHTWVHRLVSTRASERIAKRELPQPPSDASEVVPWFEARTAAMVDVLASVGDDEPVWNWSVSRPHVAGFWPRRMAHETSVHRYDAECAAAGNGDAASFVPAALAVDGIDEILDTILPTMVRGRAAQSMPSSLGGTLHAHCTDVPGEWLVSVEDGAVEVQREHAKGDAAVRAPASVLFLFLSGRMAVDAVDVFGDEAVVGNWLEVSRF